MLHPSWGLFELGLSVLAALALGGYSTAVILQQRRGRRWNRWRTVCFTGGIVLVVIAMLPPVVAFAHHDLRGHMLQHLLLGMFAPLGLVFGAPVTLLMRSSPAKVARALVALLRLPVVRFVSHPVTAAWLNIGGMYLLYFTPLYAVMHSSALVHALVHWHFLVAGCVFSWAIAGPDPAPHRPSRTYRLVVVFISMAGHAFLAKAMYAYGWPAGTHHSPDEIKSAAKIMYYGGDAAESLLVIALFWHWLAQRPASSATEHGVSRKRLAEA